MSNDNKYAQMTVDLAATFETLEQFINLIKRLDGGVAQRRLEALCNNDFQRVAASFVLLGNVRTSADKE